MSNRDDLHLIGWQDEIDQHVRESTHADLPIAAAHDDITLRVSHHALAGPIDCIAESAGQRRTNGCITLFGVAGFTGREPVKDWSRHEKSPWIAVSSPKVCSGHRTFQVARPAVEFLYKLVVVPAIHWPLRDCFQQPAGDFQPIALRELQSGCHDFIAFRHHRSPSSRIAPFHRHPVYSNSELRKVQRRDRPRLNSSFDGFCDVPTGTYHVRTRPLSAVRCGAEPLCQWRPEANSNEPNEHEVRG